MYLKAKLTDLSMHGRDSLSHFTFDLRSAKV